MLALAALFMSALALAGCATSIADMPIAGTPAQRAKIQAELVAARDRQASTTAKEAAGK
jgi:hypothetical protein